MAVRGVYAHPPGFPQCRTLRAAIVRVTPLCLRVGCATSPRRSADPQFDSRHCRHGNNRMPPPLGTSGGLTPPTMGGTRRAAKCCLDRRSAHRGTSYPDGDPGQSRRTISSQLWAASALGRGSMLPNIALICPTAARVAKRAAARCCAAGHRVNGSHIRGVDDPGRDMAFPVQKARVASHREANGAREIWELLAATR